jgi:hypothetical protein
MTREGFDPAVEMLLFALCGAALGLGAWCALAAARGWPILPDRLQSADRTWVDPAVPARLRLAAGVGLAAAVGVGAATRLPVLGLLAAGIAWVALDAARAPSVTALNRLGGAVASWCETIRQELDAGQPLRAAVVTSCDLPPRGLEQPLRRLAARLDVEPLPDALWAFAREVRHPAVGQTVAALEVAYWLGAGDLPRLMASQVEATRHRVQVLRDLHAARAKHRRAMVLLLGLFLAAVAVLFAVWPTFLDAYRPATGQLVLAGIGATPLTGGRP